MKKTLNKEQAAALTEEWKETLQAIPSIREQLNTRINTIFSQAEITDQDMNNLENAFQCIQKQLAYFPSTIRSYSRRCAKILNLDTPENLEKLKDIRESAESVMGDFESMRESVFRKLSLKRMQNGVFVLLPQPEQQQKEDPFPPVLDEESGK